MEEISIKELLNVLFKRKKIIIVITLIALITSSIINFIMIKPVYQASTVLMLPSFSNEQLSSEVMEESIDVLLNSITYFPNMTLDSYKHYIKQPSIMEETINYLKLENHYDVESLASAITLYPINNTNLITISIQNQDPGLAAAIVNKVGEELLRFVSNVEEEQAGEVTQQVSSLMESGKKDLDNALGELKEFLRQPRGTMELSSEFQSKVDLITSYKTEVSKLEIARNVLKEKIDTTKEELKKTPQVLITKKSVSEDSVILDIAKERSNEVGQGLYNINMENEEINPVHVELSILLAQYVIQLKEVEATIANLEAEIDSIQIDVDKLQIELVEKNHKEKLLTSRMENYQNNHDAFVKKYENLMIAEKLKNGNSDMMIVAKAYPPTDPISSHRVLNTLLVTSLALIMSAFLAFFMEYWRRSDDLNSEVSTQNQ